MRLPQGSHSHISYTNRARNSELTHGFTLTELLVAIIITLIIGGAIAAIIPRFFSATSLSMKTVKAARALDSFDIELQRDFDSLVQEMGFYGNTKGCAFWTIRQTDDDKHEIFHVSYQATKDGYLKTELPYRLYLSLAYTNAPPLVPYPIDEVDLRLAEKQSHTIKQNLYKIPAYPYEYGTTNIEEKVTLTEWSNPTNAPARLKLRYKGKNDEDKLRLYHRRSRP